MSVKPRNIWAVGRNYADHAAEMKTVVPREPMVFLKSGGCAVTSADILLPAWASEVHHEIEVALKFDHRLEFSEFALALDLTERRMQSAAKANGTPWTLAKSFKGACPVSPFKNLSNIDSLKEFSIELEVNGERKQTGRLRDLIFSAPVLREYLLAHFPVEAGDWLLTGTPAGVGSMRRGDLLVGRIPGQIEMRWSVL